MSAGKILRIYLDDGPRERAQAGSFNIMNKIQAAFEARGFRVDFVKNSEAERAKSIARRGYALFHMDHPFHPRALTIRRAYFYPFWRIEASAQRWDWAIAQAKFDPVAVNPAWAESFANYWRAQLFPELGEVRREGQVYIPLQGRLLDHRSFQAQSPLDMIRTTLAYETQRDIVIALHPKEDYSPEELAALKSLIDNEHRLSLSKEPMENLLERCDYVVTQNSSAAFSGYFLGKPSVLFAKIDFHHIAANVLDIGVEAAFAQVPGMAPDFDAYLHWFLKETAINGGAPDVEEQVISAVRQHGWEV